MTNCESRKSYVLEKKRNFHKTKMFNIEFMVSWYVTFVTFGQSKVWYKVSVLFLCFIIRHSAGCTFKFTVDKQKQYHSKNETLRGISRLFPKTLTFKQLENRSDW